MGKDFLNYANSFQSIAKLRLESITALLDKLGNPQKKLRFVHVAGTNGKGSVCAFLESIFIEAGLKCGKYSSPELLELGERICVNGVKLTEKEVFELIKEVEQSALKVQEETGDSPTQFEIWTAAAFCHFLKQGCDIVVLEVGLGGERDATNVIDAPEVAVITKIAMDHMSYLGNSLSEIAQAKAGIIKNGTKAVVTVCQQKEVSALIEDKCKCENVPFVIADGAYEKTYEDMCEVFSYKDIEEIKSSLAGHHQIENATLAIETAMRMGIDNDVIKRGIAKAQHKGRLEVISDKPLVIYDGAHNLDGMTSLINNLERYFSGESFDFIMAFMADKDVDGVLKCVMDSPVSNNSLFRTVTVKNNERAMSADRLSEKITSLGASAKAYTDSKEALKDAMNSDRPTVICGSLYLYKDMFGR